jgi:hypothetical protein
MKGRGAHPLTRTVISMTRVKGVLGISSPSSVFHEIGQNVVKGFASGVGSAGGILKKAVIGMAEDALGFLSPHAGPPGVSPGKGGIPPTFIGSAAREGNQFNVGKQLWDEIGMGEKFGLHVTSGYRPGAVTKHGTRSDHSYDPSRAVDMAGSAGGMASLFRDLIGRSEIKQAFYDPLGSIFNGIRSSYREGGHSDHIHMAEYDRGGWLPTGLSLALNNTGRPERVGGGGDIHIHLANNGVLGSRSEVIAWLREGAQQFQRRNNRPAFGAG